MAHGIWQNSPRKTVGPTDYVVDIRVNDSGTYTVCVLKHYNK